MRPLAAPEKSLRNVVENKYMKERTTTNIAAGVVIKLDGKYLLIQENSPGGKIHELWSFPSGKVDKGETIEEAAVREAKEESGYFA